MFNLNGNAYSGNVYSSHSSLGWFSKTGCRGRQAGCLCSSLQCGMEKFPLDICFQTGCWIPSWCRCTGPCHSVQLRTRFKTSSKQLTEAWLCTTSRSRQEMPKWVNTSHMKGKRDLRAQKHKPCPAVLCTVMNFSQSTIFYAVRTVPKYKFYSSVKLGELWFEQGRGAATTLMSLDNVHQVLWWRKAKDQEPKAEMLQWKSQQNDSLFLCSPNLKCWLKCLPRPALLLIALKEQGKGHAVWNKVGFYFFFLLASSARMFDQDFARNLKRKEDFMYLFFEWFI